MGNWVESQPRYEKVAGLTTFLKGSLPSPKSWDPQRDPGPSSSLSLHLYKKLG